VVKKRRWGGGGGGEREEKWLFAITGARQLDYYFQNPETCIRTSRKKTDTLKECTLFYIKKIQVIE
jgi:hypothetical protein